jgi:hypothetical protein
MTDTTKTPQTPEGWTAHHYKYGFELGSNGIGAVELMEDWPEVFQNDDIMRGWRDGLRQAGDPQKRGVV